MGRAECDCLTCRQRPGGLMLHRRRHIPQPRETDARDETRRAREDAARERDALRDSHTAQLEAQRALTDADLREGSFASYDPKKGLSFSGDKAMWKEGAGGVDLRGATLASAKLSGAVATNSNFEDANLSKATFIRGDLTGQFQAFLLGPAG